MPNNKRKSPKICPTCKKEFIYKKKKTQKHCSRKCADKRIRTTKEIVNLSKSHKGKRGTKASNWKGGKRFHNGYILVYAPEHPHRTQRFYIREHRLVMENHLGRYLKPTERVHHINHDKTDNRIENLQLFKNHSEHMKRFNHRAAS